MADDLKRSLHWWREILASGVSEKRPWVDPNDEPAHIFCDAASTPPYLGAVLFIDGSRFWTHMEPPEHVLAAFHVRNDSQIMGLELLSVSLGLGTFANLIRRRRVVLHSDNKGSEKAIRRGSARKRDHAQLDHHQWMCAATLQISVFVKRVATDDNLADLPSRKDFGPMTRMGMQEMDPVLVDADLDFESWAGLAERWKV